MKIISVASPKWANAEHTAIDAMVEFEGIGVVPFTATPGDVEAHGRELFAALSTGEHLPVAEYVPPAK